MKFEHLSSVALVLTSGGALAFAPHSGSVAIVIGVLGALSIFAYRRRFVLRSASIRR
jgi:uncharacterized membrane protein